MFLLFVQLLHLFQFNPIILKNDVQLRVEVALQRLALQDRLERRQQPQRVLYRGNVLEALVDEVLQGALEVGDLDLRGASCVAV